MAITLKKLEKLQKIHKAFEDRKVLTIKDLNNILGMSRKSIYNYLEDLELEFDAILNRDNKGKFWYLKKPNRKIEALLKNEEDNEIITEKEYENLKECFHILRNFKPLPFAEKLNGLLYQIERRMDMDNNEEPEIIVTEFNKRYKGYDFFNRIYEAIKMKRVLEIKYQPFEMNTCHKIENAHLYGFNIEKNTYTWRVSPWLLKEYNNRWQVIGYSPNFKELQEVALKNESDGLVQIALDRIVSMSDNNEDNYVLPPKDFNNEFEYIIGFTRGPKANIELWFDKLELQYVKSKPLHWSQALIEENDKGGVISLEVVVNREFKQEARQYLPNVKVLSPQNIELI
jgi:predicted DNA-binding transcriptional regulator YafY